MSDSPQMVTTRKRGRPRASEPHMRVSTWVSQRQFDRLCGIAQRRGVSVSSLVRRVIVLQFKDDTSSS